MRPEPRILDQPKPGFFRLRLVKNGPWVAAKISYGPQLDTDGLAMLDEGDLWSTRIDDELIADPSPDPHVAHVDRVWIYGEEITEAEYEFLLLDSAWQRSQGISARKPVELRKLPPILPPGD